MIEYTQYMKNAILVGIVAVVIVLGAVVWFAVGKSEAPLSQGGVIYCQPDGTFSDIMPIQSHRSYCVKSNASEMTFAPNTPAPAPYTFSIIDDQGNTLKDFAITHTKQMHVIVVRKDLANFQHVHPDFDEITGVFTLSDLTFLTDGEYRIFADFAPEGGQMDPQGMPLVVTLSEDVAVGNAGNYQPLSLGGEERSKTFSGNQVALTLQPQTPVAGSESMLAFSLARDGKPVTDLQEYLGALGHTVVLREGTLDFIHAHPVEDASDPQNGTVNFMVAFPQSGKYKVFSQFQRSGTVFTTDFVVSAMQGENPPAVPGLETDMPSEMNH